MAIKDESGLEEESHRRTTITAVDAAATIYSLPFFFLFFLSTGQSISHLWRTKKILTWREEEKTVCRSAHIYSLWMYVCILLAESDDCRVVFFFFSFSSLEKWMCRCRKDIFLFFPFLSFVWSRPKKERKKNNRKM